MPGSAGKKWYDYGTMKNVAHKTPFLSGFAEPLYNSSPVSRSTEKGIRLDAFFVEHSESRRDDLSREAKRA